MRRDTPEPRLPLNILHLSDIHFKYELNGTIHDLDHDVRNELEIDVKQVIKQSGPINAIVVTGDLAFAGKVEDYEVARKWLATLCEKIGCETTQVWVVPGNHDIDRDSVTEVVRTVQNKIQEASLNDLDRVIRQFVHDDPMGADVLASPLKAYYKFSAIYGCKPTTGDLTWNDDLALNMGYTLRLVGLNSALVSNRDDHIDHRPLVVGQAQLTMPRKPGCIYVTLCHHPVNWLKDGDEVHSKLCNRATLQLFGHLHEQALKQVGNSLVVQAGALHPDREQEGPWCPAYNVLTLETVDTSSGHSLSVTAYPRVWCEQSFSPASTADRTPYQKYTLTLDKAVAICNGPYEQSDSETRRRRLTVLNAPEVEPEQEHNMANPVRQLAYGFLTLPYSTQIRIASRLSLLTDEDAGQDSATLFERLYQRARERQTLATLWDHVSSEQGDVNMTVNPYLMSDRQ